MENCYDHAAGDWVTNRSRYEQVMAEPRFQPIREADILVWPPERAWALILEFLAAVPEDTVSTVGAGPREDFVRKHAVAFVGEIEAELARNPRLQRAVIEINLRRGELPPAVESRILVAFGPRFWLLDHDRG